METALPSGAPARKKRTFLGEPMGLAYLAFTEAWERFSYYGMTALLTLYMSQQLFQPEHIGNVAGFSQFRAVVEGVFGQKTTLALASQVYGLYTGCVYLTPILGGIIADRWIGRRNAVAIGAVLMSAGHISMAFDQSFLLALFLLIIGVGLLKGNISTQVGQLYAPEDGEGRTRGFSIFSIGINVGAVAGPIACGLLAELYGWHWGFGLAGVLMLLGLITYLIGYRELANETATANPVSDAPAAERSMGWKPMAALIAVMAITIFQSVAYYQNTNVALVWISQHVDLNFFGFSVPEAWFNSIDPFVSILIVPVLIALWKWQARHGGAPDEMGKIAQGAAICLVGNLILIVGTLQGERTHVIFPILYNVMQGIGFIYYWPTLLALVAGAAPPKLKSTLMGVAFLTLFVSNTTIGSLGGLYETMSPTAFWGLHAAIAAAGAIIAFLLAKPLMKILREAEHAQE